MTVGTLEHYESDGIAILPVFPNWSQFIVMLYFLGMTNISKFANFWQYSGIMVKIRDEISGEIFKGTSFSKPVTEVDRKKLNKGVGIIKQVLKKAGAKDDSIMLCDLPAPIPRQAAGLARSWTRISKQSFETFIACDASVMPAALGLPVVWTVAALGKRLAHRLGNVGAE